MLCVLSPAKRFAPADFPPGIPATAPVFLGDAARLGALLKAYSPWQLESLLGVSPQLGLDAFSLIQNFDPESPQAPALLSFRGLAYRNLDPASLTREELGFAQEKLRILSAQYGFLRPLDGVSFYRLDFFAKLSPEGKNLYSYWGDRVARALFAKGEPVVNLASAEYTKLLEPWLLPGDRLLTVRFVQRRRGKLITLPTAAKAARGQMARWIIQNRVDSPRLLTEFSWGNYRFCPQRSGHDCYTFLETTEENL